jgi:hypothetical protein
LECSRPLLLCRGSTFPSHRWYVNGMKVAEQVQAPPSVSDKDPTLTTGQPAREIQQRAENDRSAGPATAHDHALGAGVLQVVELPAGVQFG